MYISIKIHSNCKNLNLLLKTQSNTKPKGKLIVGIRDSSMAISDTQFYIFNLFFKI